MLCPSASCASRASSSASRARVRRLLEVALAGPLQLCRATHSRAAAGTAGSRSSASIASASAAGSCASAGRSEDAGSLGEASAGRVHQASAGGERLKRDDAERLDPARHDGYARVREQASHAVAVQRASRTRRRRPRAPAGAASRRRRRRSRAGRRHASPQEHEGLDREVEPFCGTCRPLAQSTGSAVGAPASHWLGSTPLGITPALAKRRERRGAGDGPRRAGGQGRGTSRRRAQGQARVRAALVELLRIHRDPALAGQHERDAVAACVEDSGRGLHARALDVDDVGARAQAVERALDQRLVGEEAGGDGGPRARCAEAKAVDVDPLRPDRLRVERVADGGASRRAPGARAPRAPCRAAASAPRRLRDAGRTRLGRARRARQRAPACSSSGRAVHLAIHGANRRCGPLWREVGGAPASPRGEVPAQLRVERAAGRAPPRGLRHRPVGRVLVDPVGDDLAPVRPAAVATTGVPASIASTMTCPNGSGNEPRRTRSASIASRAWARRPRGSLGRRRATRSRARAPARGGRSS